MSSKFFTNESDNTLLEKFIGVFKNNPYITEFDALVGYFYASGYFQLRPHLSDLDQIRILVGINVDKTIAEAHSRGLSFRFRANDEHVREDYRQQFQEEIENSKYNLDIESSIHQFVDDIHSKKIVIRAHPSRNLHAKIYIFRPKDFNEHISGEVITGSSNLTAAGLGADQDSSNYEFNVSLRDYDDIKFATDEFEKLWNESVEIPSIQFNKTLDRSHLSDDCTPHDLYIKFLIEYFGGEIEFNPNSIFDLPTGWKRLNYQIDAVEQGLILLQKHNGFFLSDVVGLGKTVIAVMIAKRFFYSNGYPDYRSHTLIVCPPAVESNWNEIVDQFQVDNMKVITSGRLHKIQDYRKYDLIIVDEAHKFRNSNTEGYAQLESICKSNCRNGKDKRVIVVTATLLNNRPNDIKNQLLLFQNANESTLGININSFFYRATKEYEALIKRMYDSNVQTGVNEIFDRIRRKIIEPLTVRRTRTDLINHSQYALDIQQQGITFPVVSPPNNLMYELDSETNKLYEQSIQIVQNSHGDGLNYARYRLIEFLKPEHKRDYQHPEQFTKQLSAIIKTLLIKRLDSSFHAFHSSLKRLLRYSEWVLKMFADDRVVISGNIDVLDYIEQDKEDELFEKLTLAQQFDPSIKILTSSDFDPVVIELLEQDHETLEKMESQWRDFVDQNSDPKFELLVKKLPKDLLDQEKNKEKKLVIFSESADTANYLSKNLEERDYRVLIVTAQNRSAMQQKIKQNFDASLSRPEQQDNVDILITTDSLAEGVNLHRSNTIVNYDTPWNSTRLMQRIGRINRIGSNFSTIYIYNFFPTEEVEGDIRLRQRAQLKLQAFHKALGEDSQIYTDNEIVQSFGLFDQNISGENEISERLASLMEIRQFKENHPDEFIRIKNLPLKSRNAVIDMTCSGGTFIFLRNASGHDAFYFVDSENQLEELGFLEARNILKKNCDSKQTSLPKSHYGQIQHAFEYFESQVQKQIIEQRMPQLTTQSKNAILYLDVLGDLNITDQDAKEKIDQAKEWIKSGRSQNLPRMIGNLRKTQKKSPTVPEKQLEALIKIIDKSKVDTPAKEPKFDLIRPPKIVISQSYVTSD